MAQTHGDGGPDAPRASPQDVAAGPTASLSSGLGFILESGESKDNDSGWRKELLDSLLKDSAMAEELITTNLRVGWYGHDSVVGASGEYSLEAESNDDSDLWNPPQQIEECLICFVPMPLAYNHYTYFECCGKRICDACCAETNRALKITNSKRKEKDLPLLEESCAFCRTIYECEDEISHLEKRVQKGDVDAMVNLAFSYADGDHGLIKNEDKRLELLQQAADLGHGTALGLLGHHFAIDSGTSTDDLERGRKYLKEGAKRGCDFSRYFLAVVEEESGLVELAIKHWQFAAQGGHSDSMEKLWEYFHQRMVCKEHLESTLRAYQASCERMHSEHRRRWLESKKARAGTDEQLEKYYQSYYDGEISAKILEKQLKAHRKLREEMME